MAVVVRRKRVAYSLTRMIVPQVQLNDLVVPQLDLVKETVKWLGEQDHSRWVFRTRGRAAASWHGRSYLKIWNPTYVRRDNVLDGLAVGFYDELTTPALCGTIFHKGVCRGYVVKECKKLWKTKLDSEFIHLIKEKSAQTGYFSYQFSRYHVMRFKGHYNLIDLEGIYALENLPSLPNYYCQFDDRDYGAYILELYAQRHGRKPHLLPISDSQPADPMGNFLLRAARRLWAEGKAYSRSRREQQSNQIHLIQR